jgi:IrrE N-terminal-like domain
MPITDRSAALTPGQIIAKFQQTAPVDVVSIAYGLGLRVWEMPSLPITVSGKIFRDPLNGGESGFSIGVNATEHATRKRFSIAHEIAHFILHRHYLDNGELVDDAMYRSQLSSQEESQANFLAAEILMPIPLIQSLIAAGYKQPEQLAEKLEVSLTAMKIRLGIPTP